MEKDNSVRQLPVGQLQNLKKMFEQEKETPSSKPTPPSRPPMPAGRIRSPARPPTRPPQSNNKPQLRDSSEAGKKQTPELPTQEGRRVSPTVSRRITALMGGGAADDKNNSHSSNVSNNASALGSPKKVERRNPQGVESSGVNSPSKANPAYGRHPPEAEVKDTYSKVIKRNKDKKEEESAKHVSCVSAGGEFQRREAVRLNTEEKRRTVIGLDDCSETSGVSVASRTKLFDQPRGEKLCPPKKPEAIKRQASLRSQILSADKKKEESSQEETTYCDPWESNIIVEKLKQNQSPKVVTRSSSSANPASHHKPVLEQKPSIPLLPPPKPDNTSLASPAKTLPKVPEQSVKSKLGPPPKPPRTHAHDGYLKGKQCHEEPKSKPAFQTSSQESKETDTTQPETVSVRDRISKMQNQSQDSSSRSSAGSTNESGQSGQSVIFRHQPPSRPPPPRQRPVSGGNLLTLKPRSMTEMIHSHEGPVIIPISPSTRKLSRPIIARQTSSHGISGSRHPKDKLPPAPDNGRPLGRYPLRRSFSSECIHGSQGSSLNDEELDQWSCRAHKSYESHYEAVIDPDGYAVPNEFLKIHSNKPDVDLSFYGDGEPPQKFLTRIDGFGATPPPVPPPFLQDGSPGFGANTAMRDQSLEKVNKKKMLMVKQKINQVYADVDIIIRGTNQNMDDEEPEETREVVIDQSELKRRIEHCSSMRLRTRKSIKMSKEYLSAIYPQLFEYCLVVGLRLITDATGYEPYIIHKFPENVSSNLSVPSFCFPDAAIFKPGSVTTVSESYSFVMTSADGTRVYGYCRRIQPSDASLPEVICIISPIDAFNMYNTLLNEIEIRRRQSLDLASEVIAASFGRPLPKPGKVCNIRTLDDNGEMETIFLNRPSDNRLNDVNYESPLVSLGTEKLVKVFSSMLMERRIILCSSNLSILTQTVHALCALLYPFQWQHVYIPLLPMEMLDVVCSPTPFIIGVLSAFLPQVLTMEMEEVLIVDLDKKSIVRNLGDEATILPKKLQRALKTAINMCKIDSEARTAQWLMVAESFLRMFIEVIGHFGNHVCTQQDGNRIFQKEGFIIEVISKEVRQFLEWFTETQMFEVFIVNHVEKSDWGSCDLFMQRLQDFKETKEESRRHRGLGAKVKNFGKAIKTKLVAP